MNMFQPDASYTYLAAVLLTAACFVTTLVLVLKQKVWPVFVAALVVSAFVAIGVVIALFGQAASGSGDFFILVIGALMMHSAIVGIFSFVSVTGLASFIAAIVHKAHIVVRVSMLATGIITALGGGYAAVCWIIWLKTTAIAGAR